METCRLKIRRIFAVLGMTLSAVAMADMPAPVASAVPETPPANSASENHPASAPNTQIWECTTNGVRTFSSNPCGSKSTVKQLNPLNVMEAAPVYRATPNYSPSASPAPPSVRYNYPEQDNGEDAAADNSYSGYPGVIVVPRARHVRPNNARPHPRSEPHPHPHHT
jgi:hypothetical protein